MTLIGITPLLCSLLSAPQTPPLHNPCYPPDPPTQPLFTSLIYDPDDGERVWGHHQYYEDRANTVFCLARDLVHPEGETVALPDVILFNFAHFDPPEGIPAATRKIMVGSIDEAGLQLYVNYTGIPINGPSVPPGATYRPPTFFQSEEDVGDVNTMPDPPVPGSVFFTATISATRGAFGVVGTAVAPHSTLSQYASSGPDPANALYVTAGIGYGLADIDASQLALAQEAMRDRLFVRNASGVWEDRSDLVTPATALEGNSSGVAFADFNGDGWMDLYVGKSGDNYLGAENVLLFGSAAGTFSAGSTPEIAAATSEVAPFDVDFDGDLDIVVGNRCRSQGTCASESLDYVLVNGGSGTFSRIDLPPTLTNPPVMSDTRSVAVGDIDQDGQVEIVLGNAGADGFSNAVPLPLAQTLQIIGDADSGMGLMFEDETLANLHSYTYEFECNPPTSPACLQQLLEDATGHLVQQVMLIDLFGPVQWPGATSLVPDGWLDLVVVNYRDILVGLTPTYFLNNSQGNGLDLFATAGSPWTRTVCFADFVRNGSSAGALDIFMGRGNRFSGVKANFRRNFGGTDYVAWDSNSIQDQLSYDGLPGTEHGYGFDFADTDGDGFYEALQASRGYNYLVDGVLSDDPEHRDLVSDTIPSNTPSSNKRGQLLPRVMEDGVFADFNQDGLMDVLMASGILPSGALCPMGNCSVVPGVDTMVLEGSASGEYLHTIAQVAGVNVWYDTKIDLDGRTAEAKPESSDRAVAADLDNDGDIDAIMHLFPIKDPAANFVAKPIAPPTYPLPREEYSFGWRYLKNVIGEAGTPPGVWFIDVAPQRMRTVGNPGSSGIFSGKWNRHLGMDVLADFDNDGALDLYTTNGVPAEDLATGGAQNNVTELAQTRDLLFLNRILGRPVGTLTEVSATIVDGAGNTVLPPSCTPLDPDVDSCGSYGIAIGDLDNDGLCDAIVTHLKNGLPWLLINRLDDPSSPRMVDEYALRVPLANLWPEIHPASTGIDNAQFPAIADFDADGDNDIVFGVQDNVLRFFRNLGEDINEDGVIDASDGSQLGMFEDASADWIHWLKPTTDYGDLMALDVDRDGDIDIAVDPFGDMVTFWRNDNEHTDRPAVTEIWPRVGSVRGVPLTLKGARLGSVDRVDFVFPSGTETILPPNLTVVNGEIHLALPTTAPVGLAQVRVRRTFFYPDCPGSPGMGGQNISLWSRQKAEYFVLE